MRIIQSRFPVAITLVLLLAGPGLGQSTSLLSVGSGGGQSNGESGGHYDPPSGEFWIDGMSVSEDGRYVSFTTSASNVVPGDTNGTWDVFVRDRLLGSTTRVSVGPGGVQANDYSTSESMSADGHYVAFRSGATNLVPGDTNGKTDVFVRDLQSGTTVIASVSSAGVLSDGECSWLSISATGRYVVFSSNATNLVAGDTNGRYDVFVRDLVTGTTTRASVNSAGAQGNGDSGLAPAPSISSDGRYVVFASDAGDLVIGDLNGTSDVFLHDMQTGATTQISVSSAGVQGNDFSSVPSMSTDGRYIAFSSYATNLVAGDTNGMGDVFLYDRQTATTTLVSWNAVGGPSSGHSLFGTLSGDGRHIAFMSLAPDIVSGGTNGCWQLYGQDLQTGARSRVSTDSAGNEGNSNTMSFAAGTLSADGRYVEFTSGATNLVAGDTNGVWDVFLHDLQTGATTRESVQGAGVQGDRASYEPAFSDGARYVAFASWASNILPGDVNDRTDVFVRDLLTGATTLASVSSSGTQGNQTSDTAQVSSDGRYVAFFSISTTLVPGDANGTGDVFVRDLVAGTTEFATLDASGAQVAWAMPGTSVSMSSDGRYVAFTAIGPFVPADTNGTLDVYVRDRLTATTIRASVASSGAQGDDNSFQGSLSADGRYVAFASASANLVPGDTNALEDVFVRDLVAGTTARVNLGPGGVQADGQSLSPSISPDGRYVTFWSDATNLVAGDTNGAFDVFVRDLQTGTTTRESVDSSGGQANGTSTNPSISRDGRYVVFVSEATNLVQGDTNGVADVFLRDRLLGQTTRISVSTAGVQGDQFSSPYTAPVVSADGRLVAFDSYAANLVSDDTNGVFDVFLRDRGYAVVFAPFCFGDGTSGPCPCGNQGPSGRGCQNSIGMGGADLAGTGLASLAADTVVLTSTGEPATATSVLLQGTAMVSPVTYGDGLRCIGGSLKRLYTHNALGGAVSMPPGDSDPTISARSAAMGAPIPPGASRFYQIYYRDPSPGFCPPPTGGVFNISSAVAIVWGS